LDNAQHGDFRIAERDKPGVDAVGAGVGHGLRRPLETRAIAGKGINRLGFYSSRRRMRLLELIDLADMLGMIRPETKPLLQHDFLRSRSPMHLPLGEIRASYFPAQKAGFRRRHKGCGRGGIEQKIRRVMPAER
jgi:hypothetical protein